MFRHLHSMMLEEQGFCDILNIDCDKQVYLLNRAMAHRLDELTQEVNIVLVGKYTDLSDAYLSVIKSLQHAALAVERKLNIDWIEASDLEGDNNLRGISSRRKRCLGPGFYDRGIEGKFCNNMHVRQRTIPWDLSRITGCND